MSIVEFLEKASTMFSGFLYDINQMIIEKDIFIYMFDIVEYYSNSDFIIQKVFKILTNIFKARNEDIQNMVWYLLEDTRLIPFLLKHGPKVSNIDSKSPE